MALETCDKCPKRASKPATADGACSDCGKTYHRCGDHGGADGVKRSLHSHRALHHPKGDR